MTGVPISAGTISDTVCKPTDQLYDMLRQRLGGTRRAQGVRSPEQIMEVWTDTKGGWTMIVTYASGTSCIVAMGKGWEQFDPAEPA